MYKVWPWEGRSEKTRRIEIVLLLLLNYVELPNSARNTKNSFTLKSEEVKIKQKPFSSRLRHFRVEFRISVFHPMLYKWCDRDYADTSSCPPVLSIGLWGVYELHFSLYITWTWPGSWRRLHLTWPFFKTRKNWKAKKVRSLESNHLLKWINPDYFTFTNMQINYFHVKGKISHPSIQYFTPSFPSVDQR